MMKHTRLLALLLAALLCLGLLAGCGTSQTPDAATDQPDAADAQQQDDAAPEETDTLYTPVSMRVGSLKGATSMGLVGLMQKAENGEAANDYAFTMATAADELLALLVKGELDAAAVPANVASVLYNKTEGGVSVININTLGVLYVVATDESITTVEDLAGKTIYLTGKGTSPDYVLQYLLSRHNMTTDDVKLEYKSEATEVLSTLAQEPDAVALLPQPFVTAACAQVEGLGIRLDMTKEWEAVADGSLVTGVTVIRNEFLQENQAAVDKFLEEYAASADYTNENPAEAAALIADLGIVAKAPLAEKAIPFCNITCQTGETMKTNLSSYLQLLFDLDPTTVGGSLPGDDFYYIAQ